MDEGSAAPIRRGASSQAFARSARGSGPPQQASTPWRQVGVRAAPLAAACVAGGSGSRLGARSLSPLRGGGLASQGDFLCRDALARFVSVSALRGLHCIPFLPIHGVITTCCYDRVGRLFFWVSGTALRERSRLSPSRRAISAETLVAASRRASSVRRAYRRRIPGTR
jgi:hypothetical protein